MSKMGNAIFEMQEDAYEMTEEQFVAKHGKQNAEVYRNIQRPSQSDDPSDNITFNDKEIPF